MSPPETIAHFRITGKLGEGGMGAVFRATDTKLNRDVAIKVLPDVFSGDEGRMARFTREAQVLASLNHPNIAAIYGVEEGALVMELADGVTLAERIQGGPIPLDDAIPIARQIAEALEYAHERGIVHRDLKPANLKVAPDGAVKVLDFGLAKAMEGGSVAPAVAENSPTITFRETQAGVIMGTASYMSPEQAAGRPVDRRADIWSFGVVLWEMLSGKKLFEGETVSHTLADVLRSEIDLTRLPAHVPRPIRELIGRCLDRDVKQRLRDIGEARIALQRYLAAPTGEATPTPAGRAGILPWMVASACALLAAASGYLWIRQPAPEIHTARFLIDAPPDSRFANTFASIAISPDGRNLVYSVGSNGPIDNTLWLRPIDTVTGRPLPETTGANMPFWSPDNQSLAFYAGNKLKRTAIAGGAPLTLCDAVSSPAAGGAWNRDGTILFAAPDGLYRVSATGGAPSRVTRLDPARGETAHGFPQFLPDGRRFLFFIASREDRVRGIYSMSMDQPQQRTLVLATDRKALFAPARLGRPASLLWVRDHSLVAQPFDPEKVRFTGEPVLVAEGVELLSNSPRAAYFLSDAGALAFHKGLSSSLSRMAWFGRDGKDLGDAVKPDHYYAVQLSPDGKQAVFMRRDEASRMESTDLWMLDLRRSITTRLTSDGKVNSNLHWSPDGGSIAFSSDRGAGQQIYRMDAFGVGPGELLTEGPEPKGIGSWSRDGRYLVYTRYDGKQNEIWALPMKGGAPASKPFRAAQAAGGVGSPRISPDGKWIAYSAGEAGRTEVFVEPFLEGGAGKSFRWQVSAHGGGQPMWRADGKEIFYVWGHMMHSASVRAGAGTFETDAPRDLFPAVVQWSTFGYDVTPDGQRFLILTPAAAERASSLTVVLNWQAGLK